MAKLHATTPAAHVGQGERAVLPKINRYRQALRHNSEEKQRGELEELDEKATNVFRTWKPGR